MPTEYHRLIETIVIKPVGEPLYAESVTRVSLDDETGGAFVKVAQDTDDGSNCIRIDPDEWPLLRRSIDRIISACKKISP